MLTRATFSEQLNDKFNTTTSGLLERFDQASRKLKLISNYK